MFAQGQQVELQREVEGVLVPAGTAITLPEGMSVQITQALGNFITLFVNGNLVRISAQDSDAAGLEPIEIDKEALLSATEKSVIKELSKVYDPEIPVDIYELGLIYKVDIDENFHVDVEMTLTAPGCPVAGDMPKWVEDAVLSVGGISSAAVRLVFDPPWDISRMSEEAQVALNML